MQSERHLRERQLRERHLRERYLRHALIDWFPQSRVRAARIAVIGAGAVGNEVVKNLALLGCGAIDVFDLDRVELHNLTRSVFLREADVGTSKASAVVARAREVDPAVTLRAIDGDFWRTLRLSALRDYDCAIACVDNFEARIRLSEMCLIAGVDCVNAAIDSRYASVEVFPFATAAHSPCYECHLPDSAYQRIAERYSCGGLRKRAAIERKVPTTTITASICGALAASMALRLGPDSAPSARRVFIDTISGTSSATALTRRADCGGCGAFPVRPRLYAARNDWRSTLAPTAAADTIAVRLSDPLITAYLCVRCGDTSHAQAYVGRRASDFDDGITLCAVCGERAIRIEIRSEFALGELTRLFGSRPLPAKYLLAPMRGGTLCIDLEETSDDQ